MAFLEYLADPARQRLLLTQSLEHSRIVGSAMLLATVIGLLLGITAHRVPALRGPILTITSTFLTIPSLALFALMIPIVGIGDLGPIIALTLYALLAVVRNTVSGLLSVDGAVVEAAAGMGMGKAMRLWRIELPNAWPAMLAGLRVSTLLTVGLAAIAALVGGNGLGQEIVRGIRRIGSPGALEPLLGGTLGIVVLALLFDLLYLGIGRLTIPRGIRD